MDERELLLLGMLKAQSQHGYQINEFIERNLSQVTDMKKATGYAVLDRLGRDGYVSVESDQVGNRPPRKVYSITPAGEARFLELVRANLKTADRIAFAGDIGLMFLDELPLSEVLECLKQRLEELRQRVSLYEQAPPHGHVLGVDLALNHVLHLLRADRDWLEHTIETLPRGDPAAS